MAITMTGSGGLFTRLGSMGRLMNIINRFTGDDTISLTGSSVVTDLRTEFDLVKVQFDGSEFPISQVIEGMHADVDAQISNFANLLRRIQAAATDLVVRTVMADNPIPDLTIDSALAELITQMLAGGYYVSSSTISTTLSAGGSNVGDGTIVTSMKDDIGRPAYHCFQESLRVAVTTGGTLGSERLKVSGWVGGPSGNADPLTSSWPIGSGSNATLSATAADGSASKVTNGSFEAFVANVPTGWTISVGTAGTTVKQSTGTKFTGASSLEIDGNGSELTALTQTITGLKANTPYAIAFATKMGVVPAAGVLTVDLYDGASVINSEAGVANSFTVDLTALSTSFQWKSGIFQILEPIPATVTLRLRLTTALTNTRILYIDNLVLVPMTELYAHGPWSAAVSGSTAFSTDDTFTINTSNNRSGKWQEFSNRWFGMAQKRLLLPYSGSTLIADSLLF